MYSKFDVDQQVVFVEAPEDDSHLATLAGMIAADVSALTYEELLATAMEADQTAAAWLLEDVQAA